MKRSQKHYWIILTFICLYNISNCQNPLISHIFAADPSAHVWQNDTNTLWLYTSHDVPGTNHHATMSDYHVFSTKDMINWIDYGRVLSIEDVKWGVSYAWAPDAVCRHGKYYLVFCMYEKNTGKYRTGLAISDVPQGPFKDIGYIKGVDLGQDPCVFTDDDNTPYLYWGAGGHCYAAQLADDLKSIIIKTKTELTSQLTNVFEGPWVHKYNHKYYLSYPGLNDNKWPEEMVYAISEKPLGPYKYMGKYISVFKGCSGTNHGSICKYKDNWIALYHSAWVSGGKSEVRNLMANYLYYNADGTIKPVLTDTLGITNGVLTKSIILLEAENAMASGGKLEGTKVESSIKGYSCKGYVTGFKYRPDYVEVLVQVAKDMDADLKIRLSSDSDFYADILVGVTMLAGWEGLKIHKTIGWEEIDFGKVRLKEGDNKIRFTSHDYNIKIDYFKLEPIIP